MSEKGYTLIELALVVCIVALLASIAIPKFSEMFIRTQEGSTKGNLGALRSALAVYYGENEGAFPTDLTVLVPKYINRVPEALLPPHQ